ncbi:hypothetical protein ELI13_06415 [Rhizobium ruizarguesonis]|uniref:hypothetical protein n=1 Tax=Rhizobium ruizarguesonis TaxID=2081791 RepID=UPI0010320F27|nr:hypothetical protein [Rhizobium ruizarguesonis]TAW88382.1 hypothetical protein ELI13_06415 [Rhizobium ruizarguesonis]
MAEAARVAGIHRAHLDVIINRTKPLSPLFSERRRGRRWFSAKDITVLRIAYELERAGRNWPTAIAQAFEHLATPPPNDALLVVPVLSVSSTSGRVLTGLPALPSSDSMIVLPIGRIANDIVAACEHIKETAVVAV